MPLRYADLNRRKGLLKDDAQKNMTDLIMTFEISEVKRDLVDLGGKHTVVRDYFLIVFPIILNNFFFVPLHVLFLLFI